MPLHKTTADPESSFEQKLLSGVESMQDDMDKVRTVLNDHQSKIQTLQKRGSVLATSGGGTGKVSDECARFFGALCCLAGIKQGRFAGRALDFAEGCVKDVLEMEIRSALTTSDIPLPTGYGAEVSSLLSQYGSARKYGTVFPLPMGATIKLPRLKTTPTFSLVAASGSVPEVSPQTEWVDFPAEKFAGLVRLPSEIEEESVFNIGQFLANYMAYEISRIEDYNFFRSTGAGSGQNGSVKGLCESTITNTKVVQMASTKTKYSDATLANLRAIRGVVDEAALSNGAYYLHTTFEQHLSGLNSSGDKPYIANGVEGASLDGFPIRWVPAMPAYSTTAAASKVFCLFGDLRFQYLGVKGGPRFDTSRDAAFTTDEILVRGVERFTLGLMALGAVAGLQTAAS